MEIFHDFELLDIFILLRNIKMPTIVGILTLMSMIKFIEHDKIHAQLS